MPRARRDRTTPDLFDWEPPALVARYDEVAVRAATLRARIARAVSETLSGPDLPPRDEVARRMSDWLGETVTKAMLDAYASPGRAAHTIPYLRLLALVHVTRDARLLQLGAEMFGFAVIEDRFLPWVEVGQLADRKDNIDKAFDAARRQARRRGS